jgi:transposase InsO family protein
MTKERNGKSVDELCSFFEKSRQAYYQMLHRKDEANTDGEIIVSYVKECRKEMPKIGTRKLLHMLQPVLISSEIKCGRDKLFFLLGRTGLLQRRHRAKRCFTRSLPISQKFPNLIKDVDVDYPEQVWVSDTTGVPVRDGLGFLTLTTDMYSKQVMGYNMQRTRHGTGALATLRMALGKRCYPERQLTHHSDGGKEYFNCGFMRVLVDSHIKASCTAPSSPQENPVAERINGILKQEFLLVEENRSFDDILKFLPDAIRLYNERRPHTSIDYMTPAEAHRCTGPLRKHWKIYRNRPKPEGPISSAFKQLQQKMCSWA